MHVEAARRLRHVAVAQLVHALNVLPTHTVRRHRVLGRGRLLVRRREQCVGHVAGAARFAGTDADQRGLFVGTAQQLAEMKAAAG